MCPDKSVYNRIGKHKYYLVTLLLTSSDFGDELTKFQFLVSNFFNFVLKIPISVFIHIF
jgi:hypothetical protein